MTEKLHIGDNLEYMKSLQSESIDLIYCDILYGTGRDFGDYKDIKAARKTVEEFYIPRITEMHRLLKPTGSIYLQMDTRINHWLRCILDDIFGYDNFRNEIVWKRSVGMNQNYKYYTKNTDRILFFTKTDNYTYNHQFTGHNSIQRYNKVDDNGRRYMNCNIMSKKNWRGDDDYLVLNGEKHYHKPGLGFALSQQGLEDRIKQGYVFELNSQGYLSYRQYADETEGVRLSELWTDILPVIEIKADYKTEKNIFLLSRIIKASSNEGDVCADFFAGSGSFGVAAKKLNRNVILCDINPKAIKLSKKRLNEATDLFNCC